MFKVQHIESSIYKITVTKLKIRIQLPVSYAVISNLFKDLNIVPDYKKAICFDNDDTVVICSEYQYYQPASEDILS